MCMGPIGVGGVGGMSVGLRSSGRLSSLKGDFISGIVVIVGLLINFSKRRGHL